MKQLIINADDFGYTKGVNQAILQAFVNGIVTSASIMANGQAFEHAVELVLKNRLAVGCHLSIVDGKAISDREKLLPASLSELMIGLMSARIRTADIVAEFRAQIQRVRAAGIVPTHLDTHKHSQVLPQVMQALVAVAAEFKIPCVRNPYEDQDYSRIRGNGRRSTHLRQSLLAKVIRVQRSRFVSLVRENHLVTPDYFFGTSLTGLMDSAAFHKFVRTLKEGTTEMMCHPGFCDADLDHAKTRLKSQREDEFSMLTDPHMRATIQEHNIELMSYADLAGKSCIPNTQ